MDLIRGHSWPQQHECSNWFIPPVQGKAIRDPSQLCWLCCFIKTSKYIENCYCCVLVYEPVSLMCEGGWVPPLAAMCRTQTVSRIFHLGESTFTPTLETEMNRFVCDSIHLGFFLHKIYITISINFTFLNENWLNIY